MINDWDDTKPEEIGNVHFITLILVSANEMYKLQDINYRDALKTCIRELHEEQLLNYATINKILHEFGIIKGTIYDNSEDQEIDEEAIEVYSPKETYKRFIKIAECEGVINTDDKYMVKMKETYGIE